MRNKIVYIVLILFTVLMACNNAEEFKYPTYKEGEENIAQLLLKNYPHNNEAHILDYSGKLWKKESRDLVQRIAEFYNLDGYEIHLYDTLKYGLTRILKKSFEECLYDKLMSGDCILPYDYRMNYVDINGDTIAKLLWRYEGEGILYTSTVLDKEQLETVMRYLHLNFCTIYDHEINRLHSKKFNMDLIGSYAYYNGKTVLFRDRTQDVEQKNVIRIDNVELTLISETSNYIRFNSMKELNYKQILKALKELDFPTKIVYFHKSYEKLDYSSCVYFESKDWYNIGMFSINKSYQAYYNRMTSSWETKDISTFK